MNPTQSILLFIFLTNSAVSLSVYFTNPKRSQNRLFLLFSTSLSVWVLFVLSIISSDTLAEASVGIRGASIAGASIPVTFYLFCQAIANPSISFAGLCKKSLSILLLSIVVIIMCLTDFFLDGVTLPDAQNSLLVPEANYGKGFLIFMAFFPIVIYRTIYVYYQTLRNSEGMAKIEMQFTLVGMTSALPFAVIVHMLAIISGSSSPQQFGPLCIIPMNLVIAYGIATRRILGIEKVLRQAIAYALLAAFLIVIYLASWNTVNYALSDLLADPRMIAQIIATIISLLAIGPIQHNIHVATSKLIATKSMDVSSTMKAASTIFQSVTTIDQLLSQFSNLAQNALHAKSIAILEPVQSDFITRQPTSEERSIRLDKQSIIVKMLISAEDLISIDNLSRIKETHESKKVIKELISLNSSVATGIFQKGKLTGILLVLARKRTRGRIYDRSEQSTNLSNSYATNLP